MIATLKKAVEQGEWTKGLFLCQSLLEKEDNPEVYFYLAFCHHKLKQWPQAIDAYVTCLRKDPQSLSAYQNLACLLHETGLPSEAIPLFQQSIRLQPNDAVVYNNLGRALRDCLAFSPALEAFESSLHLQPRTQEPRFDSFYSNYLYTLHFLPEITPEVLFEKHAAWGKELDERKTLPPYDHAKIRVGYLSPDLAREHSVTQFFYAIAQNHDRERFSIYCFIDQVYQENPLIQPYVDSWVDVRGMSTKALKNTIQQAEIDILVDLAGHTGSNHLPLFAKRAAPIQISYLGYPGTTGLTSMDLRLTDAVADLPEAAQWHTEKLAFLPHGFLCYTPSPSAPPCQERPFVEGEKFTFGSFNILRKLNEPLVKVWSQILSSLPGTRLLLKAHGLTDKNLCQHVHSLFAREGIDPARVLLKKSCSLLEEHFATYHDVDLALDTFPYNGTTTTCEALWMGVPVLTYAGRQHAHRVGASILHQIDLEQYVAFSPEEYVQKAIHFARNSDEIQTLSKKLRERMRSSPLCDGKAFTKSLEDIYLSHLMKERKASL